MILGDVIGALGFLERPQPTCKVPSSSLYPPHSLYKALLFLDTTIEQSHY
jgi:hypothetical protein